MTINNSLDIIRKIKLLISDVDGILTDGKILIGSDNTESKFFNVEDGTGAALAYFAKIPIALISGRYSKCTEIRASELKVEHCFQNTLNKTKVLHKLMKIYSVEYNEIAYIGDSLVDIPVLNRVGYPISVPNAHGLAKKSALHITKKSGGQGVLLEVVELILKSRGQYDNVLELMSREKFE